MAHLPGGGNTTPPPPQRSAMLNFADASGNLTAQGQQVAQQIQAVLSQVAVTFPWIKWFQTVQQNLNNANDLSLLEIVNDESGGRSQLQAVIDVALAGVFGDPNVRPNVESVVPYLNDATRPPQPEIVTFESNQRSFPDNEALLSSLITQQSLSPSTTVVIQDIHDHRTNFPAAAYKNSFYWETDRTLLYLSDGTSWNYVAGIYYVAQASIPGSLGTSDAGLLVGVTDFMHNLRWDGSAYGFAPGDDGSGYIASFTAAPVGGVWQLCDGTASVTFLKADGTTGTITVPNLTGQYAKYTNGGYGGVVAKSGNTADESSHTHDVTIANNAGTVLSGPNDVAAAQTVTSAAGTAHHHGPGTLELDHVEVLPYFRR